MTKLRIRVIRGSILGALILGFLAVDFVGILACAEALIFWDFAVLHMLVGAIVAQVVLLAAWSVMGPGNWVWRWPCCLALAAACWSAGVGGLRWAEFSLVDPLGAVSLLGALWFCGLTLAWIPLGIAVGGFGWRLTYALEADRSERAGWYFQLKDLLLASAFIGLMLGPASFVLPPGAGWQVFAFFAAVDEAVVSILAQTGAFMAYQLAIVLPWVWVAFARPRANIWRIGACVISTWLLLEIEMAVAIFTIELEFAPVVVLFHCVEFACLLLPLIAFRLAGLQLVRISPRDAAKDEAAEESTDG
ncbi:hypothetical protein [Lignipirellula cremea]|uniref:Uncharacterized protein n=1 Tax=Lignipirellula cremea TaxID=2528010 RepID=A0A518DM46_9BACT|nr:hypothetical protein [Lignipirellula cremea]QDU92905.1 hypothetical protein Pla8534_06780 [Lignipirellula cremea]